MISTLKKIWLIPSPREKLQGVLLLAMMVVSAFVEILGIGLIVPVIAILANPGLAEQNRLIIILKGALGHGTSDETFILALCFCIIILFIGKNLFLASQAYWQARYVYSMGARLGTRLFQKYLRAPYSFHLNRNSGHLIGSLSLTLSICSGVLMPGMILLSETIVILFILGTLLLLSPLVTICLAVLISGITAAIYFPLRQRNYRLGVEFQREQQVLNQYALQGLKSIKESKIRNVEDWFIREYEKHQTARNRNMSMQNFLGNCPRFAIEAVVVCLGIGTLAILILLGFSIGSIILTLSLLAVSLVRMLPSFSRIQYSFSSLRQNQALLEDYHREAVELAPEDKTAKRAELPFKEKISVASLSYRYPGSEREILKDFSLNIPRNSSVAIVGPTGCGKTTLVDLILGLLKPEAGAVLVDGISIEENLPVWQTRIGYVPQFIFLLDDSIKSNVAFGVSPEQIDEKRVRECLETAQIWDFVSSLPDGLDSVVGENGIRLSGGQRQRLGIARALYHNPITLILDEATSALDHETEKDFVDALKMLQGKLTIITIAHRLTTIKHCDQVIELQGNQKSTAPKGEFV